MCEYAGELLCPREASMRERVYQACGLFYLFNLESDHSSDLSWTIDATRARNVAGFINHRCHQRSLCNTKSAIHYSSGSCSFPIRSTRCGDTNLTYKRFATSCTNRRADGVPGRIGWLHEPCCDEISASFQLNSHCPQQPSSRRETSRKGSSCRMTIPLSTR